MGLGADVSTADLERLDRELQGDLRARVNTRFGGECSIPHVFAYFGKPEQLAFVLDRGADKEAK